VLHSARLRPYYAGKISQGQTLKLITAVGDRVVKLPDDQIILYCSKYCLMFNHLDKVAVGFKYRKKITFRLMMVKYLLMLPKGKTMQ
jgi:hypothetical protein